MTNTSHFSPCSTAKDGHIRFGDPCVYLVNSGIWCESSMVPVSLMRCLCRGFAAIRSDSTEFPVTRAE